MAKTTTFDIMKNMEGLTGFSGINEPVRTAPDRPAPVKKEADSRDNTAGSEQKAEPKTPAPVPVTRVSLQPARKKEPKSKHKNFLISEKHAAAFAALAKSRGQSENALLNDILEMLFDAPAT